jgi:hypothetical protein
MRDPYRIPIIARIAETVGRPRSVSPRDRKAWFQSIASKPIAPAARRIDARSRTGTLSTNVDERGVAAELPAVGEHSVKVKNRSHPAMDRVKESFS